MAVLPVDLLKPKGHLAPALFPGVPVNRLKVEVQEYIDQGQAKVDADSVSGANADAAVRAWAYHLAFEAAFVAANARPLTVSITEKGSHGYSAAQIANLKALSEKWEGRYDALLPAPLARAPRVGGGGAVTTDIRWGGVS